MAAEDAAGRGRPDDRTWNSLRFRKKREKNRIKCVLT